MRIYYKDPGSRFGFGASLGEVGFWGFLLLLGALPFIACAIIIYAAGVALAAIVAVFLIVWGVTFKLLTGRDARVPVTGSTSKNHPLELWMEKKGWIRIT